MKGGESTVLPEGDTKAHRAQSRATATRHLLQGNNRSLSEHCLRAYSVPDAVLDPENISVLHSQPYAPALQCIHSYPITQAQGHYIMKALMVS